MSVRPLKKGEHRTRCTLWDIPESSTNSVGQPSLVPVQIVNTLASDGAFSFFVRPLRGNEQLNVRQIWPTATHIIKSGWLGSAIPKTSENPNGFFMQNMKLINTLTGEVYNIVYADNPDMRFRQWVLTCEQKIGATS